MLAVGNLGAAFFSMLVCQTVQRILCPVVSLLGPPNRCDCPQAESAVTPGRGCWEHLTDRDLVRELIKWSLLLVEHVAAEVAGALVVVELYLVRIAAVLRDAELRLTLIEERQCGETIFVGYVAVRIEHKLRLIKATLITVGAGLFAFGNALIYVG
jgi:hypothetical protein